MSSTILPLDGRVAIVTGSSRGIGAATARLFARSGARVVLSSRTLPEANQVAQAIDAEICETLGKGRVIAVRADVGIEADIQNLFSESRNQFGPVDILVNNAAIATPGTLEQMTAAQWDELMAINLRGPFLCSREAFAQMTGRGGSIINISSLGGIRGTPKFPGLSAYVTSKFGIVGLTESLAVEGKPLGIRVNCVAPGAVDTQMLRQAAPFLKTSTTPEDVAKTLLFLADSSQSGCITGSVVEIHSNL